MNVLCVVAHPDDEVLGCGGTLAKHVAAGDDVGVLILGRQELALEAARMADVLGLTRLTCEPFPDQAFETVHFTDLVTSIERADSLDVVYTHNPDDLNLDHALTARAVLTAFRPTTFHGTILAFETISSTEFGQPFQPNWYEVLTAAHVEKKVSALHCYPTEVRLPPHPRNEDGIRNRAMLRGYEVCAGYAEAFRLLRRINAGTVGEGRD